MFVIEAFFTVLCVEAPRETVTRDQKRHSSEESPDIMTDREIRRGNTPQLCSRYAFSGVPPSPISITIV